MSCNFLAVKYHLVAQNKWVAVAIVRCSSGSNDSVNAKNLCYQCIADLRLIKKRSITSAQHRYYSSFTLLLSLNLLFTLKAG